MRPFLLVLVASCSCLAQSTSLPIEKEHAKGVAKNPPGVTLTIATVDSASTYHLADLLRFRLSFTGPKSPAYTAELAPGGSAAAASDDFIVQGPDSAEGIHSRGSGAPVGVVCCGSNRRGIGQKPLSVTTVFKLKMLPSPLSPFATSPSAFKPGDYVIFIQTRRVMRGWPNSSQDRYFAADGDVVTSTNILHITMLPDVSRNVDEIPKNSAGAESAEPHDSFNSSTSARSTCLQCSAVSLAPFDVR